MIHKLQQWQTLIAGITLALSIGYAATVLLKLSYVVGHAAQQHDQIIKTQTEMQNQQGQILHVLVEKCK